MTTLGFDGEYVPALLALADGSLFSGISVGAPGQTVGEVVFNTSMTGYQEILTDPSYAEQLVTLTYPHIGNVGVNPDDEESSRIWVKGLIIRNLSPITQHWRAKQSLAEYLLTRKIVAIAEIDTRRLTRLLREKGAQNGCIMTGDTDPKAAIAAAQAYPGLVGMDLAKEVSILASQSWKTPTWESQVPLDTIDADSPHIVVYDFGTKYQILRLLVDQGCRVTQVPAQTPAKEVIAMRPDGILLSNGPGDPSACDYAITAVQEILKENIPLLGICLGFQLLALAAGVKTHKMKFGHHGANHPVLDLLKQRVMITSQNHGFCVTEAELPAGWSVTHRSLFDQTLQGIMHDVQPVMGFQGHPEASPGPNDMVGVFKQWLTMIELRKQHAKTN